MRWQITLANAGAIGLLQNLIFSAENNLAITPRLM
jgi:hypothetical protein